MHPARDERRCSFRLDEELDSYRTIVRTEPEAASAVGKWIAAANQERRRLETMLGQQPTTRLTPEDIKALIASLQDITATLAAADPADKAKAYAEMGIDITYHQDGRVIVESRPHVVEPGVGEALCSRTPPTSSEFGAGKLNRPAPGRSAVRRSVPLADHTDSASTGHIILRQVRSGEGQRFRTTTSIGCRPWREGVRCRPGSSPKKIIVCDPLSHSA